MELNIKTCNVSFMLKTCFLYKMVLLIQNKLNKNIIYFIHKTKLRNDCLIFSVQKLHYLIVSKLRNCFQIICMILYILSYNKKMISIVQMIVQVYKLKICKFYLHKYNNNTKRNINFE